MGCDIHLFQEYKKKGSEYWRPLGAEMRLDRNYYMFGLMSKGVRIEIEEAYPARGLPTDLAYEANDESKLFIVDDADYKEEEDYCSRSQAEGWVKRGSSVYVGKHWVTHPDWHSHSWLTATELKKCLENYIKKAQEDGYDNYNEDILEYEVVLVTLEKLEQLDKEARIVFWFDN